MSKSEYLAFIPLLIYGIGITLLLADWRRLLNYKSNYWPYTITTLLFTEIGFYNVFIYNSVIKKLKEVIYIEYLAYLITPILFLLMVNAHTPEKGDDTKVYFDSNMRLVFLLFAFFSASHYLYTFNENFGVVLTRVFGILLAVVVALARKPKLVYLIATLWFVILLFRGQVVVT